MTPTLTPFDLLPLGTRFRYTTHDRVYVIIEQYKGFGDSHMEGTVVAWRPDLIGQRGTGQGIFHFDPSEAPDGVIAID